jgi:hypothetical protein
MTMTEAIQRAIRASSESWYAIAKATQVEKSSLSRFMAGQTSLRLDLADRLALHFGLELRPVGRKLKAKGRRGHVA